MKNKCSVTLTNITSASLHLVYRYVVFLCCNFSEQCVYVYICLPPYPSHSLKAFFFLISVSNAPPNPSSSSYEVKKILIVTGSPLLLLRRRSTGCRWLGPGLPLSLRPLLLPAVLEARPFRAPHIPLARWLLLLLRPPRRLHAPAVAWEVVGALAGGGEAGAEGGYGVCWSSLERGQRGQDRKKEIERK